MNMTISRILIFAAFAIAVPLCGSLFPKNPLGMTMAEAAPADGKALVVYYSWSGNTREIAAQIHRKVGGDLVELEVAPPYSSSYRDCVEEFKKERDTGNSERKLTTQLPDMEQYQTIYIGYPIWGGGFPTPIRILLASSDWSGKTVVPFCSHGGGGAGRSFSDIEKMTTGAKVLPGLSVRSAGGSALSSEIEDWLRK